MNVTGTNQTLPVNSPPTPSNFQQSPSKTIDFQKYVGTLGAFDKFLNIFRPLAERKIEFSNQNQTVVIKIKDLSQKLGISTAVIYEASKNDGSLENLIRLSEHLTSFGVPSQVIRDLTEQKAFNVMINLFEFLKDSKLSESLVGKIFSSAKSELPVVNELLKSLKNTKLTEPLISHIIADNKMVDLPAAIKIAVKLSEGVINLGVSPSVIEEMYKKEEFRKLPNLENILRRLEIDPSLLSSKTSQEQMNELLDVFYALKSKGVPSEYINEALKKGTEPSLDDYQAQKERNNEEGVNKVKQFVNPGDKLHVAFKQIAPNLSIEDINARLQDPRMQNKKMQDTIVKAAEIISKRLADKESQPVTIPKTSSHFGFSIDEQNNVYVREEGEIIGKGQFKTVKNALNIREMNEEANVTIKGENAKNEVAVEQQALIDLRGCRHIIPPSKFQVISETKKSEPKYVLMQKKLSGDGRKLFTATPQQQLKVFRDVAEGLGDINERNWVHKDVKLDNFLIDEHYNGYVHDFGLMTKVGVDRTVGSIPFMPPEYLTPASNKFDSFALGISMLMVVVPDQFREDPNDPTRRLPNPIGEKSLLLRFDKSEMNAFIQQAKDSVDNSASSQEDKEAKLKMINVAEQLLKIKPKDRITCAEAAIKLA